MTLDNLNDKVRQAKALQRKALQAFGDEFVSVSHQAEIGRRLVIELKTGADEGVIESLCQQMLATVSQSEQTSAATLDRLREADEYNKGVAAEITAKLKALQEPFDE